MLLIPAMNEMFDIGDARVLATRKHPPAIVFVMLGLLALAGSLLAGYGMAGGQTRSWIHIVGFALRSRSRSTSFWNTSTRSSDSSGSTISIKRSSIFDRA
jgi:hypothetical protein